MICTHCGKNFDADEPKCPFCGAERADAGSGVFQSSTVLISAEGSETVYRSVDEVPDSLRTKLLKSTNSANSATILIADRRGRKEIAKAMRSLPGTAQRRMLHSILGGESASGGPDWLTPNRRKAILGVVLALALLLVAFVFTHR
jgi:RNA polymerase subunit RPABC4/transcription elongation factor Spt4